MSKDKFKKVISWEDLQSLGDPDNSDINVDEPEAEETSSSSKTHNDKVRVYLEKKGRRGKSVTLIKGLSLAAPQLDELCKDLKTKCGVGGKREGRDVMIQGDQRKKVVAHMESLGYKDVKNAGA